MPMGKTDGSTSRRRRVGVVIMAALLLVTLGACSTSPVNGPGEAAKSLPELGNSAPAEWRYARFRLQPAPDGEVNSYLDGLIADRILEPLIVRYADEVPLWRFHRRWPDDATGHQFSFIFFAAPAVGDALIARLERAPLLQRLKSDGDLIEFRVDRLAPERASDPAATSDTAWPIEIQREWPKFIMGASSMWLGLVGTEADKRADLEIHQRYQAVEIAVDEMWFKHGNHAFFHHLSALFGYKPVRVIRRDVMTF